MADKEAPPLEVYDEDEMCHACAGSGTMEDERGYQYVCPWCDGKNEYE